jgi:hypothetical protein
MVAMDRWNALKPLRRARQMSFALLLFGAVENGVLHADYTGARPNTCGLTRVERDLQRRVECRSAVRHNASGGSRRMS